MEGAQPANWLLTFLPTAHSNCHTIFILTDLCLSQTSDFSLSDFLYLTRFLSLSLSLSLLTLIPHSLSLPLSLIPLSLSVIWNGPMGVFEFDAFAKGTNGIATTLAQLTGEGCITIIGGGGEAASISISIFLSLVLCPSLPYLSFSAFLYFC